MTKISKVHAAESHGNDILYNLKSKKHTIKISDKLVGEANGTTTDQSFSISDSDEGSDDKEHTYLPSRAERIVNYLLCRPDLAKTKLKARPVSLVSLFRYADRFDMLIFSIGILCALLSGFGQPVMSIISGTVTNVLLTEKPDSERFRRESWLSVYLYLIIGVVVLLMNYIQFMCFQSTCSRVIARLRQQYIRSILRQNAAWFDRNQSGELTTRLNDNIERIREGIGDKLGLLVRGCAMFIAALVIAFIYQWRLALVMCGVAPISCFIMAQLAQQMSATTSKELIGVGKAGAIAEESILGVRTVQAFNGQEEMVERYKMQLSKGKKHGITKSFWSGFLGGLFFVVLIVFMGGGLLYGGYLLQIGIFKKPGDVFVVVFAILIGSYFLGVISPHLMVLLNARVAAGTIYQTIDREPKIDAFLKRGIRPIEIEGRIVFKDVHFRYPSRKNVKVLDGLNLAVEPGQTVALVGHSGCGKSTSVGLLTRLYEAESGVVTIDGYDVRDVNIEWLRNVVGVVQQEPILFNDTVEENLKAGNPDADISQMIEVCRMANAHDFIQKLPQGYKTRIGDAGVQLSGGQKQRIAIARTLIRNPKILLLDEATSALDTQSEAVVQKALNNASIGRTTIVIAHRLSTVRGADQIAVIDKGSVIEQGTHNELIAEGGAYAKLVKAQQFQTTDDEINKEDEAFEEYDLSDVLLDDIVEEGVDVPENAPTRRRRQSSMLSYVVQGGAEAFKRASIRDISTHRISHRLSMSGGAAGLASDLSTLVARATDAEMAEEDKTSAGLITVYRNAQGNYTAMALGTLSGVLGGLYLPSMSLLFTYVFEAFQDRETMIHKLSLAVAMYCGVAVAVLITQFASAALFGMVSENVVMSLRIRAFRNILLQDAPYFDNPSHAPGNLITRLAADAPNVKAALDSRMVQVVMGVSGFIASVIIGFIYNWQVALVGTVFSVLLGAIQIYASRWVYWRNLKLLKNDEAGRFAIEIIEGVKTIQLLTREDAFHSKYTRATMKQQKSELRKEWIEAVNFAISQTFQYFIMAVGYAIGIHAIEVDWQKHRNPLFTAQVFNSIIVQLMGAIGIMNSAMYFPEFIKAKSSAGLLFTMIERKPKTGDLHGGEEVDICGNVMFDHVSFSYPQKHKQPVMNGLQFNAARGQTVALVGESGCGKSTVISLLERFYDPNGGSVRFDGKDLRNLSLYYLRSQMALVGQEPRLFAGSIRENICFGLQQKVSTERIFEALQLANAKSFVESLPLGLETDVGEKGAQLSGGQKQRIAIARAMIRNPKILLLDEATSALDSESERAVQEALDRAREGRTCITIAHRLSSIQNSDLIIYIENGHVQEMGTHKSLIAQHGRYFDLIQKQDLAT